MVLPGAADYADRMADIFDVIADATRRDLLHALLERYRGADGGSTEISVGDLVERLGVSQPTVSKHLKVLLVVHRWSPTPGVSARQVRDVISALALHATLVLDREHGERDHDLVTVRDEGQHRYYRLDIAPFEQVEDWLIPFLSADAGADANAAYAAWAGTDVGSTIGRATADGMHQARTVIHDAQEQVGKRLPWLRRKR